MYDKGQIPDGSIQFGAVVRSLWPGEPCGDGYLFCPGDGHLLFALVDGLGHGQDAHDVAVKALASFEDLADRSLEEIVWRTHERLHNTRGCVVFLGKIDQRARVLHCTSIGNITCKFSGNGHTAPVANPGVLGRSLRKLTCSSMPLDRIDTIALCSDGISARFGLDDLESSKPEEQAREIYMRYGQEHDDASVLVVRLEPSDG